MSSYRGRTGPNFSEYLNSLNTTSPIDNQFPEDNDFSNDLAMYTNTDFTNIDIPSLGQDDSFNFDLSPEAQGQDNLKYEDLLGATEPSTDFGNFGSIDTTTPTQPQPFYSTYNTPIQPAPASGFTHTEPTQPANSVARDSRRSRAGTVQTVDHLSAEERTRVAAEEDKRRRNTAASARFRVKKKQREQALEKTLKDTQEKNAKLEARVTQLEMENKWLKALITEKNGLQSKEEMAAAYEQHRKESEDRDLKQEASHTSGIGTA